MMAASVSGRSRRDPIPWALFVSGLAVIISTAVPGIGSLRLGLALPSLLVFGLVIWGRRVPRGMFGPFDLMVLLVGLAMLVSSLWAENPEEAIRSSVWVAMSLSAFFAFRFLLAAVGLRVGAAILGWAGGIVLIAYLVSIGVSRIMDVPWPATWWMVDRGSTRFTGLAAGPGLLAICLAIFLFSALVGWKAWSPAQIGMLVGSLVVILASRSRTGLLGVLFLGTLFLVSSVGGAYGQSIRRRLLGTVGCILLVGCGLGLAGFWGWLGSDVATKLASFIDDSSRFRLWGFGLGIFMDNPMAGLGLGQVQQTFEAGDVIPGLGAELGSKDLWLHNTYLEIGAGAGFIALLPVAWLVVLTLRNCWMATDPTAGYLLVGGIFTQFAFHSSLTTSLFALSLALLAEFVQTTPLVSAKSAHERIHHGDDDRRSSVNAMKKDIVI